MKIQYFYNEQNKQLLIVTDGEKVSVAKLIHTTEIINEAKEDTVLRGGVANQRKNQAVYVVLADNRATTRKLAHKKEEARIRMMSSKSLRTSRKR